MFIQLTNADTGNKEQVNFNHVELVQKNGDGVSLIFANGMQRAYSESVRSVRGYIAKASGGNDE